MDTMKKLTRTEILIKVHNEVLENLIRNEVDLGLFETLRLTAPVGQEAAAIEKKIVQKRKIIKDCNTLVRQIEDKMKAEEKKVN